MSGPKVVRVVTREEIIATCLGLIAALEASVEQWRRVGERNDVVDATDITQAKARIEAMRTLLAEDKFTELQKRVPAEIGFLASDTEQRIERATARAADARRDGRRRISAASALAAALSAKGLSVPKELHRAESYSSDDLHAAMRRGIEMLTPAPDSHAITDRQRDLASRLGDGEARSTLADWIAAQTASFEDDPAFLAIERRFEELRALDPEAAQPFSDRIDRLQGETSGRRDLLIDSLKLDIADARASAMGRTKSIAEIRVIEAELRAARTTTAEARLAEIATALSGRADTSTLGSLITSCRETLDAIAKEQAEIHRRRAILSGLADLGYEVKQGMETAWIKDGRVVMKSSKSPGYGVEVGGDPANLMQVRTVGLQSGFAPRSTDMDIAAETEFCGDFKLLKARLEKDGDALSIVKAMGVGTTPVKTVQVSLEQAGEVTQLAAVHNVRRE
jgi:hypothetical protein